MNRYNRRYNPLSPPFNNHQRPPNLFQELASLNYVNRHNQELVDRNRRFYQELRRNNNLSHNPVNLQRFNNCNTNTRHGVRPTSPIQFHGIPHDQFQKGHGVYGRNMRGWTSSNKPAQLHMSNPLAGLRIPRLPSPHRRHPAPNSAPHASRRTSDRLTTSKTMPNSQPLTNGGVSDESCVKQPKDTDEDSDNCLSNCSTLVLPVVGRVKVESAFLMKDGVSGGLEYSGDVTEMVQDSSGTERENLELVLGDSEIDCVEQQTIKSEEPFETKCDVNSHEKTENGIRSISKDRELLSPGVMQTIKTEESFEPKCDVNGHEKTENGFKSISEDRELLSPGAMQTFQSEKTFEAKCDDVNSHEKTENGIKSITEDRELLCPGAMQTFQSEETFEIDVNGHENGIKSISEDRELLSPGAMQTFQSEETFEIDVNGHENGIKSISVDRDLLSPSAMQTFTSEEIFQTKCDVNSHEKTENGIKSISEDRELLSPDAMQTFQSKETFETKCDVNGHGESENGIKSVSEDRELLSPDAMQTFQSEETFETMCDVNSHEKTENGIKSVSEDRELLSPGAMQTFQSEKTFETKCVVNDHSKSENGIKSVSEDRALLSPDAMQTFQSKEAFETKCDVNSHENTENGAKSIFEGCELLSSGAMETFKSQETCENRMKSVSKDRQLLSPNAMQTLQSEETFETKCYLNGRENTENGAKSIFEGCELLSSGAMETFKSQETCETKCDINGHEKTEYGMKSITEEGELLSSDAMQTFKSEETFQTKCDINALEKTENGMKSITEEGELLSSDAMQTFISEETFEIGANGHDKTENGVSVSEDRDNCLFNDCQINDDRFDTCTSESDEMWSHGSSSSIIFGDRFSESESDNLVIDEDVIEEEPRLIENDGEKEDDTQAEGTQTKKGDSDCADMTKEAGSVCADNVEHIAQCDFNQNASCSSSKHENSSDTLVNSEASTDVSFGQSANIQADEMKRGEDLLNNEPIEAIENNDVGSNSENPARKYNVDEGSLVLPCESSEPEGQKMEDCLAKEDAFVGNKDDLLDFPVASDGPEVEDIDNGVAIPCNCGNQSSSQVSTDISQFSESNDSATDDNLFGERGTENSKSDCVFNFTEPNNSIHSVEVAMEMDRGDISDDQSMDAIDIDMCSHSSDGMMTDGSENSGSIPPLDEAYVRNLITKAELLPDHENEKTNHDNSDFENDFPMSQAPSEKKDLDLKASERLSDVDQVDGDEDCSEHCQNPENHGDGSIGQGESPVLSSSPSCGSSDIMEEGDFKLCYDEDEQREEESLLDDAIPGCGDRGETFSPNSSLTIFNRNLDETDGRRWEENFAKGLQKLKTTLQHFDERQDKSCREDVIDHKECSGKNTTDDGMVVEQNVGNVSSFNSGVSNMNDNVLEDGEKIDSDYETHRDGLVEKSPFAVLPEDNYLDQDDAGSSSNSEDGFHLELNIIDEPFPGRSTSTVCHDEDYASCKSSSSSTVCPEQDDISCRSSTSAECSEDVENGYSSNSTVTLRSLEQGDQSSEQSAVDSSTESLTVTLSNSTDPQTGKMKWVASKPPRKQRICDIEDKPTEGHVLRKSKATESSVTRSRKRRRMVPSNPKVLRNSGLLSDVVKKPDEDNSKIEYHRLAENNSTKERLSIRMNDVAEKVTSTDHEDDDLHFGNIKELAELLKNVEEESHSHSQGKRSRSSPRKLFFAAKHGDVPQILALAASCNVNSTIPQENHKTAVHTAAAHGHVQALYVLYKLGGNLSSLDCKLRPPLFDAVENNQIEVVKFLISYKVNLTLRDSNGLTTLHIAAKKCYVEIINLLMATRKINIDEQDSGGWTALMWTAEGKHFDAAKCLLQWGASVHILDNEVNTCLHWAALSGSTDIMELFLDAKLDIDSRNKFGATALHISTRERKLNNILLLEKYGPNLEIEDSEHRRAIQLAPPSSRCYTQLDRMEKFLTYRKCTMTERLITNDISRGQEFRPIPCVNNVDQEDLPKNFVYVNRSCEGPNISFDRISMTGCDCSNGCFNERSCQCAQLSARKRFWYNEGGLISSHIFLEDRPLVYECNMKCKCWSSCSQRVVQRGMNVSLQLYKTKRKGWAVRTLALIPKGAFVCEYVGEILTDEEGDKRDDDCYLFDLDVKGNSGLFCLDAKFYGNISRFVNHSCDPNVLPVRVFTDHQVKSCPRIAFFASREIHPYEEVCSDYGERFWKIKKSEFNCACNTPKCRYKGSVC